MTGNEFQYVRMHAWAAVTLAEYPQKAGAMSTHALSEHTVNRIRTCSNPGRN